MGSNKYSDTLNVPDFANAANLPNFICLKGTIPPCSKLSFIPKLYVKRFSTLHWSCRSLFFQIKYCVACKKSTLKVLINLGFVTSFEDSHNILLFRYIYGAQLMQWFCYSKHFMSTAIIGRMVLQRHYPLSAILLTSLSIFAQLLTLRWNTYLFNEGTAGVLGNT